MSIDVSYFNMAKKQAGNAHQHITTISTIYFSFRAIDKTSWLASIHFLPLGHKSHRIAPSLLIALNVSWFGEAHHDTTDSL